MGPSWFDRPATASNVAHRPAKCSDMGFCDHRRGQCDCRPGFQGASCSVMQCPGRRLTAEWEELARFEGVAIPEEPRPCSGHGQCLSMRRLAGFARSNGVPIAASYGDDPSNAETWDADSIHGCLCDTGWTGHDCSRMLCQTGNDPANDHVPTNVQMPEEQTLVCVYSQGSPSFKLTFRGQTTEALAYTATSSQLKDALEKLHSVGELDVSFAGGASAACTAGSGTTITFQFLTEHGDLPPLSIPLMDGHQGTELMLPAQATESRRGNTEDVPCSNRGLCNRGAGSCVCFAGWGASNGRGGSGLLDDCGHRLSFPMRGLGLGPVLMSKNGPGAAA